MDHHEILGVPQNAGQEEITRAYRTLAMKYHPDRNPGDEQAIQEFKKAAEAFEALTKGETEETADFSGSNWTIKRVPVKKKKPAPVFVSRDRPWWRILETHSFSSFAVVYGIRIIIAFMALLSMAIPYAVLYLPAVLFPNMPSARLGVSFDGRVSVCKPNIADHELANLKKFRNLKFVDLGACNNITDAGLVHLHGLIGLLEVELGECPKVTAAGVRKLKNALPTCRVGYTRSWPVNDPSKEPNPRRSEEDILLEMEMRNMLP